MLRASIANVLRVGLFIVTTAPFFRLSEGAAAACPLTFPPEQWEPRVAFEAAFAGKPAISIPKVGSGFNRTLDIDGFCNDVLMNSTFFSCDQSNHDARGEFHVSVTDMVAAPTSAKITFDHVNCPLYGISIRRNKPGALFAAEIRFEFESCKAGVGFDPSPVASAAIVMGLRKGTSQESNILPWMQEVCNTATTTPATASLVLQTTYPIVNVGKGQCKQASGAASPQPQVGISTEEGCKAECRSQLDVAEATNQKDNVCRGFAFNANMPADKKCVIYTSAVTEVAKQEDAWVCKNMTLSQQDYRKTTPGPSAMEASLALTQNLQLREVFAGAHSSMTTAKLVQIEPNAADMPAGSQPCFPSAWWFTVQDDVGNPASIPVKEADWIAMMDMVPQPQPDHSGVRSAMTIDRVLLKTCNPNATGWGRECSMPAAVGVCDYKQMINAIMTGILVPIIGWAIVNFFHKSCGWGRPDPSSPEAFPICTFPNVFGLCIVAVLSCAAVAAGVSAGISYGFGAAGCLHGLREMMVVGVATSVPAALAMIFGLLYMHNSRESPSEPDRSSQFVGTGHKLMLVEVKDGQDISQGTPINPDVLQSGGSSLAAYRAQGGPSRIDVHTQDMGSQAQFLSGFQSVPPQGGSAFIPTTGR